MDMVRRMVWFAIVATAASYSIFLVLGNFAAANAQDEGAVPIRDVLQPGIHHLSGMIMVPSTCDELSVQTETLASSSYELVFTTWQDSSVPCPDEAAPREFQATAFGPAFGVTFFAELDGRSFPIDVIPDLASATSS